MDPTKLEDARATLHPNPRVARAQLLEIRLAQIRQNLLLRYRPHPKQLEFHGLGQSKSLRAFFGGNRTGKTVAGGVEAALHATGLYPEWWNGIRWTHPTRIWVASESAEVTRDVAQKLLLGPHGSWGTGIIPKRLLGRITTRRGVAEAVDTVRVQHDAGGFSEIGFKSYDQKREKFQGTSRHLIWFDEEPPKDIWKECRMRTVDADGHMIMTATPLRGMSDVCHLFLGNEPDTQSGYVCASWQDNPYLSPDIIEELEANLPEHEREARQYGKPQLGSGRVYPFPRSLVIEDPFEIPSFWPRLAGLDFGWDQPTAVVWGAMEPDSKVIHLYSEHAVKQQPPVFHAEAINARGRGITIMADPAGQQSSQHDGKKLMEEYQKLGLPVMPADNAVEAGIMDVYQHLASGKLKVFVTMARWLNEFDLYQRDEKGTINKRNDHLMDATRYLVRGRTFFRSLHDLNAIAQKKPRVRSGDSKRGGF